MKTIFFAYPGQPTDLSETIRKAADLLNRNTEYSVFRWEQLDSAGVVIWNDVKRRILESDGFACDLTYLNDNVLFELGYAITSRKEIWISIDPEANPRSLRIYKSLGLGTVHYIIQTNFQDLARGIERAAKNTHYLLDDFFTTETPARPSILYLTVQPGTTASINLAEYLSASAPPVPLVIDDPAEMKQPLTWYINNLRKGLGTVIHLKRNDIDANIQFNAKYALIAGMATGLDVATLMLAHSPYHTRVDFDELLKVHGTADEAILYVSPWLDKIKGRYHQRSEPTLKSRTANLLRTIDMGEYVAEYEEERLETYFVETAEYLQALMGNQTLFVGRKGTGKTANLIRIETELLKDRRNEVIPIRPVAYEIDGVLMVLSMFAVRSERGFFVESIWKLLLMTEMARVLNDSIGKKPPAIWTDAEMQLVRFVEEHQSWVTPDFAMRISTALQTIAGSHSQGDSRLLVSEALHTTLFPRLRAVLGQLLTDKARVVILMDNLDKSWGRSANLPALNEFFMGLLEVSQNLSRELSLTSLRHKRINISLVVFVRNDIFKYIYMHAPERDKLSYAQISWTPNLLWDVVESRIQSSSSSDATIDGIFPEIVRGRNFRDYIIQRIIPRPRDILYFCIYCVREAVNQRHSTVSEDDVLEAERQYSSYVLDSVLVDNGIPRTELEALLYEFAGSRRVCTYDELLPLIRRTNPSADPETIINHLIDITFLGIEVSEGDFRFRQADSPDEVNIRLADHYAHEAGVRRFKINAPFCAYLEIRD